MKKKCRTCRVELNVSSFSKSSRTTDGYQVNCLDCAIKVRNRRNKKYRSVDRILNSQPGLTLKTSTLLEIRSEYLKRVPADKINVIENGQKVGGGKCFRIISALKQKELINSSGHVIPQFTKQELDERGTLKAGRKVVYASDEERHEAVLRNSREFKKRNPAKIRKWGKEHHAKNREKHLEYAREYHKQNKEKKYQDVKRWRENNPERWEQIKKTYQPIISAKREQRKKVDINYKLRVLISTRILVAIKNSSGKKAYKTNQLIGCTVPYLRKYLERQFYDHPETGETMSWDNHGLYGWHIDHISPIAGYDLTKKSQQLKAFHYSNMQPLWAKENLSKGAKSPRRK